MSSEFDFEINSSDSETDDFDFEDNKKELEICVLLNVHGTVKAIVDTIDCLQKNNTKCILYILDNGSHEIYRKYIEDNILKQNYGCVSVKYHFEKTSINVDEMFQKGMDLIVNDNVEKIIFSHNYEFSNNAKEIINQHPILFLFSFRKNVLFKIENTRSETKNVKSLPLDKKPLNKPPKKNFVKRLKERKINRNVDSQTFYENKNKFRHMIKKEGKKEKKENKKKENKIGVIACTNKCKFLFNIVNNYCQQTYSNKKLFVVLNNESIDKNILVHLLNKRNANYEILHVNSKYKLGHCLNQAISKCHEQGIKYCSKFDDDDIYLPEYLTEQVNALDTQGVILVGKSVCMLYKPYTNECRLIDHGICDSVENSYTNFVWGATLTFDIQRLKKFGVSFNESVHYGSDSIFNRDVSKYGKIYATTRNNYYCLRYDDGSHTWGDIGLNLKDYKHCTYDKSHLELLTYLNNNHKKTVNTVLYVVNSVQNSGYTKRTYFLNSNIDNIIIAVNPILNKTNNTMITNSNGITLFYDLEHLKKVIQMLSIEIIVLPSNHINFSTMYDKLHKTSNLKFIYEVRGLWYLSGSTKFLHYNKKEPNWVNQHKQCEINVMKKADGLIFITDEVKNYIIHTLNVSMSNKKHIVLYNGCDTNNKIDYNKKYKPGDVFTIGYFGSITEYEGIDNLIKICNKISKTYPIKLKIIGKNCMNLNINYSFIDYTSWISDDKKLKMEYNSIDLFCIPRINYLVSNLISPLKPFDILMNKIPLLMSDCETLKTISENGKNCMIFKKDNVIDFENKILDVIKNGYNNKLLENGYKFVMERRNWTLLKKTYKNFLKSYFPINIMFNLKNFKYIYNILELRKRIHIKKHKCFLRIGKNIYNCYHDIDFKKMLCENNIIFFDILPKQQQKICIHLELQENSYFTELNKITDNITITIPSYEKKLFNGYKQININKISTVKVVSDNLNKINVVGIFDEMFYTSIKNIFNINLLTRHNSYTIPSNTQLFIVESCWNGNNGEFKGKIVNKINEIVLNVIKKCKSKNIPTIFINKEDSLNYKKFINAAKHFDYIFTTDINCVPSYKKDCQLAKGIYPFSFFVDIAQQSISSRGIEHKDALFTGSFTYKNKKRTTEMNDMFRSFYNKIKLDVVDRNSYINTLNVYSVEYIDNLYKKIDFSNIMFANLDYKYVINFNSVQDSTTMFARRIVELLVQKKIVISNYSASIEKYFKNVVFYKDDISSLEKMSFVEKEQIKHNGFITVYNNFTSKRFLNNFLDSLNIKTLLNYKIPKYKPKISVICSTNRIDNLQNIINNYEKQTYKTTELLICINLKQNELDQKKVDAIKNKARIIIIDSKYTLGYCLNKLIDITNGDIIQKIDDDDYYGENFITNQIMMYDIYKADLVGKPSYFTYVKETNKLFVRKYKNNFKLFPDTISGSTTSFLKSTHLRFGEKDEGEDTALIMSARERKLKIVSSGIFDYCYIRSGNIEDHSWKISNSKLINLGRDIFVNEYKSIPYNLINSVIKKKNILNDKVEKLVSHKSYGLCYSNVKYENNTLIIDGITFDLSINNFDHFYKKLPNRNFKFKMHTLRDIILPLYEHNKYEKINTLVQVYCKKYDKYFKFNNSDFAFYEHSISWRTILFIFLLESKILNNNTKYMVNLHLNMLWENFLKDNTNYSYNNHGLYEDIACIFYCLKHNLDYEKYKVRFINNFNNNVNIEEGLSKEHSTNYHRLYKNIADIFYFIEPTNKIIKKFIDQFNINFNCFLFENKYIQYGDSDEKPLADECTCLKNVKVIDKIVKKFQTGFFCIKENNNYFGITACRHSKNHKQNDDASFVVIIKKNPLFVDSGRYDYNNSKIRNHICNWKGHNCLEVYNINHNIANFYGASNINYNFDKKMHNVYLSNKYYEKFNINHTRNFQISENFTNIVIKDIIKSINKISGCVYLNLSPHYKYFKDTKDSNIFYINSDFILTVKSDNDVNISVEKGFYSDKTLHYYDIDTIKIEFKNINNICIDVICKKISRNLLQPIYSKVKNSLDNTTGYYKIKDYYYYYFNKKLNSKNLIVMFHGAISGSGCNRQRYRGYNYNINNSDLLCLNDMLNTIFEKYAIGYYLSTSKYNQISIYHEIIDYYIKNNNYNNIIFTGTSAGGYPAVVFASYYNSTAIISNSYLYCEHDSFFKNREDKRGILDYCNDHNDILIYNKKQIEFDILKSKPKKIIIYQNKLDTNTMFHYNKFYEFITSKNIMNICEINLFELNNIPIKKNDVHGIHGVQFPNYNYLDNIIIKYL